MNLRKFGYVRHPSKGLVRARTIAAPMAVASESLLDSQEEELKKRFGLIDLDEDITTMTLRTLRRHFAYENGRTIDKGLFIRNVIWQMYRFTRDGRPPEAIENGGNIRSIWYHVKKLVREHSRSFGAGKDMSSLISSQLKLMVLSGLLGYSDLKLLDDRKPYRRLAPDYGNTHIILLGEKIAFFSLMVGLGLRYGATIQLTRGMPSVICVDTMLTEMAEADYDLSQQFVILDFCDFDPVGWNIGETFVEHLRALGVRRIRRFRQYRKYRYCLDIVNPHTLSSDFLRRNRHKLKKRMRESELATRWVASTGGLYGRNGRDWALGAEQMIHLVKERLEAEIQPFLVKQRDEYYRLSTFEEFRESMEDYLLRRLLSRP